MKAKQARNFIKDNMKVDVKRYSTVYNMLKKIKVKIRTNWKVGDITKWTDPQGIERTLVVSKITGFDEKTGELFLVLKDDAGNEFNSAYDKNRSKI